MEGSSIVNGVSKIMRNMALAERRMDRHHTVDAVRMGLGSCLEEIVELESISVKDVLALAGRIKRRREADAQDMLRLSRAFQQDGANITAFTNTPGALQVLIKMLRDEDMDLQILACECLCNLALGTEVACKKVALAAGISLATFLEDAPRLQITALWTITNLIVGGGTEPAKVFISQKIVPMLAIIIGNKLIPVEIVKEAQTALNVLLVNHPDLVRREVDVDLLELLIKSLSFIHSNYWLNFSIIFYACDAFEYQIFQRLRLQLFQAVVTSLNNHILSSSDNRELVNDVKLCAFALRTIGNLIVEDVHTMNEWKRFLALEPTLMQRILELDDVLTKDVLWVVAETGYEHFESLKVHNSVRSGVFM